MALAWIEPKKRSLHLTKLFFYALLFQKLSINFILTTFGFLAFLLLFRAQINHLVWESFELPFKSEALFLALRF